jgi:hypothetical protein
MGRPISRFEGELTGGMVIASSIIAGRALAPIEGAIEGWNQFSQSRAAYGRIAPCSRPLLSISSVSICPSRKDALTSSDCSTSAWNETGRAQRHILRPAAWGLSRCDRQLRCRKDHAWENAGRLDPAHVRKRQAGSDGPAQLGPAPIRREYRLFATGRSAIPRHYQGEYCPDEDRCRG